MFVGSQQKFARVTDFCITERNKTLERVYEFKYLGVMLDPCHSWNDHIDLISTKISSRLGMLRKTHRVIPREACITLYDTMILPLFDYCSAVWHGCGKTNRDYLNKLQRRAVSIIEGRKIHVQHHEINRTLSWPSLESRRKYQICLQILKCLNGLAPAYLLTIFTIRATFTHTTHGTRTFCDCL